MVIRAKRLIIEPSKKHLKKHSVHMDEVEEVARGSHIVVRGAGKKRLILVGETEANRVLEVVVEPKGKGVYYVVTAYPASKIMTVLYIRKRGGEIF